MYATLTKTNSILPVPMFTKLYAFMIHLFIYDTFLLQIHSGENACYKFILKILEEVEYFQEIIKKPIEKELIITGKMRRNFNWMIDTADVINCMI